LRHEEKCFHNSLNVFFADDNSVLGKLKVFYTGQRGQAAEGGSEGAGVAEKNCTLGGIVGASVMATRTLPCSQSIVQSPRKAFST